MACRAGFCASAEFLNHNTQGRTLEILKVQNLKQFNFESFMPALGAKILAEEIVLKSCHVE